MLARRPTYESDIDRANQQRIIAAVAVKWRCTAHLLKGFYPIDYALFRGTLCSWAEVKCRRGKKHDHYPTVILSQHKLTTGIGLSAATQKPFHFVVEFADGIYYCQLNQWNCHFPVILAGRTDRDDAEDIEPCAAIPVRAFKPL